eukprot:6491718-Amphidinium_carterae.2
MARMLLAHDNELRTTVAATSFMITIDDAVLKKNLHGVCKSYKDLAVAEKSGASCQLLGRRQRGPHAMLCCSSTYSRTSKHTVFGGAALARGSGCIRWRSSCQSSCSIQSRHTSPVDDKPWRWILTPSFCGPGRAVHAFWCALLDSTDIVFFLKVEVPSMARAPQARELQQLMSSSSSRGKRQRRAPSSFPGQLGTCAPSLPATPAKPGLSALTSFGLCGGGPVRVPQLSMEKARKQITDNLPNTWAVHAVPSDGTCFHASIVWHFTKGFQTRGLRNRVTVLRLYEQVQQPL